MKSGVWQRSLRFAAGFAASYNMIFSPVALGAQAEEFSKKQIEQIITNQRLNQNLTYKEFWDQTKHLYLGQVYKELENYFTSDPNKLMPKFSVKELQSSSGEKIPVLVMSNQGKTYNLQLIGEQDKYIKFNNVVLSEYDVQTISPALRRIAASDVKLKNEFKNSTPKIKATTKTKNTTYQKVSAKTGVKKSISIAGFPRLSKESWVKLTPMQRAEYVMHMRLLGESAAKVRALSNLQKTKGTKTSEYNINLDKWNYFVSFLNSSAIAANVGDSCVAGGYVSDYQLIGGKLTCVPPETTALSNNRQGCGLTSYPCNPIIYGKSSTGATYCVSRNELQTSTHLGGACDSKTAFNTTNLSFPQAADLRTEASTRYSAEKTKELAENAKAEFDTNSAIRENTKKYLESMLKDAKLKELFSSNKIDQKLFDELMGLQKAYDSEISYARNECKKAADVKSHADKNFYQACDQLHRRHLFVVKYIATNMRCADGSAATITNGKVCNVVVPDSNPIAEEPVNPPSNDVTNMCAEKYPNLPTELSEDGTKCYCTGTTKEPKKGLISRKYSCDDGINPWWIAGGIAAALGIFLLLKKDKKKPTNPPVNPPVTCNKTCTGNTTLNPTSCTCDINVTPPTCTAPKIPVGNSCACPASNACTPGQQVYNQNTCQCDNVAQDLICPDGVTRYTIPPGSSTCPTAIHCTDGSVVYPPNTCPVVIPPSEGGSGVNPNDGGYGGVN
ncbi:MAG: hypothetical protein ACK41T_05535 [Pseudobdellovibrio sp.]